MRCAPKNEKTRKVALFCVPLVLMLLMQLFMFVSSPIPLMAKTVLFGLIIGAVLHSILLGRVQIVACARIAGFAFDRRNSD